MIINYIFNSNKIYSPKNFKVFLNKKFKNFFKKTPFNNYLNFYYIILGQKKKHFLISFKKPLIIKKIGKLFNNINYNLYTLKNFNNKYDFIPIKIKIQKYKNTTFFKKFIFFNFNKIYSLKKNKYKKIQIKNSMIEKLNLNKNHKNLFLKNKKNINYAMNYSYNIINNTAKKVLDFKSVKTDIINFLNYNYKLEFHCFKNKNKIFLKKQIRKNSFKNYLMFILDFYSINFSKKNMNIFSNKYLINYLNNFNDDVLSIYNPNWIKNNLSSNKYFNNYYPIVLFDPIVYNFFFKKFTQSYNANFVQFNNKLLINFFETAFKKNFFIKITNNNFNKLTNYYYYKLIFEYRNYQPQYLKKFLILDFIEIIWYSFLLRDLSMLSEWITKLMESLNFKNHKKFLSFFQNFLNKFSGLFLDALSVRGFFFDIRGKVGVTGSSKKRHFCYKFGSLKKSSKNYKINFNQNLVRTYSGVMGLTYILCY